MKFRISPFEIMIAFTAMLLIGIIVVSTFHLPEETITDGRRILTDEQIAQYESQCIEIGGTPAKWYWTDNEYIGKVDKVECEFKPEPTKTEM